MANLGSDYGDNVEIRTGEAFFNRGSGEVNLGNVKLVDIEFGKEVYPVVSGRSNKAVDAKEFLDMAIKLKLDKHTWDILAELLGLTASDVSAGTSSVTDESVKLSGTAWSSLAHGSGAESPISNVVVTGSGGTPTYTENTDYVVDYVGAKVRRISGGSIGDGDTVLIDYDYTTQTSKKLKIGKSAVDTIGSIRYTHNLQNGKVFEAKIYRAYISDSITISHSPDGLTEYEVQWKALQDDTQTNEEVGYVTFTT